MLEHDVEGYERRIAAFGWATHVIDGHDLAQVCEAYQWARASVDQPCMIIAKTLKGKGVSFVEDKDGWHGKTLSQEECDRALVEIGSVDESLRGTLAAPEETTLITPPVAAVKDLAYAPDKWIATRRAYGNALARLMPGNPSLVVLDAETSNSTYAELVKKDNPNRFFEMYIAEQNMVGVALGLSRRGKKPCVSTFAAFFSRAFDQIRMAQYADANILFCGSHAGVSIGEDGASQMGLEDIAMFRTLLGSVVLYPSDPICAERLVELAIARHGVTYLRMTRKETPFLYTAADEFTIGGSRVLRTSNADVATLVGAGVTLHEALVAHEMLKEEGIMTRVVDLYSIKPIDRDTLQSCARETRTIISIEDHYAQGGLGEAVMSAVAPIGGKVLQLAVSRMPKSGKPDVLLDYEDISARAIAAKVREVI